MLDELLKAIRGEEKRIETIKQFRLQCDRLMQVSQKTKSSAETTLAWRSLQMAKAWLGKALGELGDESPYTPADSVAAIPPTAEHFVEAIDIPTAKLIAANSMRTSIESIISALKDMKLDLDSIKYAIQHLAEAKMWYGYELAALRDADNKQ